MPTAATGDIPEWHQLDQTQLPEARTDAAVAAIGTHTYLFGGQGADGAALASGTRANLSPQPPFFQLGILGATIPALSIKGEIGQQIGYLNAMGVGMTNFVILVLTLGLAWPWLTVRSLRFAYANLAVDGPLALDTITQQAQTVTATGEGLAGFLDADLGLT